MRRIPLGRHVQQFQMQNISDSQIFHHSSHFLYNPTNLLSSSRFPPLKSMVSAFQPSRGAPVRSSRTTMPKLWTSSMPEPPVTMAGWHDVELSKPYWTDLLYIDILNVIYIIIYICVCVYYIYNYPTGGGKTSSFAGCAQPAAGSKFSPFF